MRWKAQRKAIYVAMGLTVLALVGGFSVATLSLSSASTNSEQQGSHTTSVTSVTGLSWNATSITVPALNVSNNSGCESAAGCNVSASGVTNCVGAVSGPSWCNATHFVEQVTLNTTGGASFAGMVNITLYVTAGGHTYVGATCHYTNSRAPTQNTRQLILEDFDIGTSTSGPAPVTSVTVIATVAVGYY